MARACWVVFLIELQDRKRDLVGANIQFGGSLYGRLYPRKRDCFFVLRCSFLSLLLLCIRYVYSCGMFVHEHRTQLLAGSL